MHPRTLLAILAALPAHAGCYAPDLADCALACSGPDDCAADQVCAAGLCRAPDATCEAAAMMVPLRVEVDGEGRVVVGGVGTCTATHADAEACAWQVPAGAELHLEARPDDDRRFDKWTTAACAGQDASCTVVAQGALAVAAKFH